MSVVISELEFGLHNSTFNFVNHSSGNVQVISLVTSLRNFSKKDKQQVEDISKPVAQEGTK